MNETHNLISIATQNNWARLGTTVTKEKLTTRANKKLSTKNIIPLEYFSNKANTAIITSFVKQMKDKYSIKEILYTIGVQLLRKKGIAAKPHVLNVLKSFNCSTIDEIDKFNLPEDEKDLLGTVYQCLLTEGEKNIKGSYYTPQDVVQTMMKDFAIKEGQTFCDPCCGSGAYLLALNDNINPEQVFGFDIDSNAVLSSKINMLLKFADKVFTPQIFQRDFLQKDIFSFDSLTDKQFTYIASNPPWGANSTKHDIAQVTSKESFSYFIVRAFESLENGGKLSFLLPEAILNIKCHKDIRKYMLESTNIYSITKFKSTFNGVITKYISITLTKEKKKSSTLKIFTNQTQEDKILKTSFYNTNNIVFNLLADIDTKILKAINSKGQYNLKDSIWALGIVTGDNKEKLKNQQAEGYEPIYTGKDLQPYLLSSPKHYIKYDRNSFQQVAKDEIYRAQEKLVYKFISNKLVFAYDNKKSLFLNSANILIPLIPQFSIKTVMAFLNSKLFQYLYIKLFGEIKILKGNLCELPFPTISKEQNERISCYVDKILQGDKHQINALQAEIYNIYNLDNALINHIEQTCNVSVNK